MVRTSGRPPFSVGSLRSLLRRLLRAVSGAVLAQSFPGKRTIVQSLMPRASMLRASVPRRALCCSVVYRTSPQPPLLILQVPLPARKCQLHRLRLSEDEQAVYDVFLARSRWVPGRSTFSWVLFFLSWLGEESRLIFPYFHIGY